VRLYDIEHYMQVAKDFLLQKMLIKLEWMCLHHLYSNRQTLT